MKRDMRKGIEIFVESVNYIIINYALSNMALLFQQNLLYILFFAAEIWVMGNYWRRVYEMTKSKAFSAILLIVCFVLHIGMTYFVGHIVGKIEPWGI